MSLPYLTAAFGHDLPPAEKLLLIALADGANDQGCSWPSRWHLVYKTGLSEPTIKRAVKRLEARGLILREPVSTSGGHAHAPNYYHLAPAVIEKAIPWKLFKRRPPRKGGAKGSR